MSGRLDQSLDSIIDGQKKTNKAKLQTRRRTKARPAPVGGIKKTVKAAKPAVKPTAAPAVKAPKDSKIVVSGLPFDVTEAQIKDYFTQSVGPIKRVSVHYNSEGRSRGIADVIFTKPDSATKAAKEQNGIRIDGRPMKIEVILDASRVPEPAPVKTLAERVAYANPKTNKSEPLTKHSANSKAKPKSAVATKETTKEKRAGTKPKPRKAKNARPKPKTAEELDAEMTDYWAGTNGAAAAPTDTNVTATGATVAAAGDDAMEEIS